MSRNSIIFEETLQRGICESKARAVYFAIVGGYEKTHPEDNSIYKPFWTKNGAEENICENFTWDRVEEGFVHRSDFSYEPESRTISYSTNRIIKKDNHYVSDGSELSNKHFEKHQKDFAALEKAEELIDCYRKEYQGSVDRGLDYVYHSLYFHRGSRATNIDLKTSFLNHYLHLYKRTGADFLTSWLNRVNDPANTIETLVDELHQEIQDMTEFFTAVGEESFVLSEKNSWTFEQRVINIISSIFPQRGRIIFRKYVDKYLREPEEAKQKN